MSSARSSNFIESVLDLKPRLAAFDCDGTLWDGDSGEGFFYWELDRKLVSDDIARWARARYVAYKAGDVSEDDMCGEMVTMHRGLSEAAMQRAAQRFFKECFVGRIFPEMHELLERLQATGCEIWTISSTNEWVIRAAMPYLGLPENRVLAAAVRVVEGKITDQLVRVPSGEGKSRAIHEVIGRLPDVAFGNSIWDAAMLGIVRHAFAINPNPDLEEMARQKEWHIHYPTLQASATET